MLSGLEIVFKRMETNWDEFVNGEWDGFFQNWGHVISKEEHLEIEAFRENMQRATLDRERKLFAEAVIQKVMHNDETVGRWTYKWVREERQK